MQSKNTFTVLYKSFSISVLLQNPKNKKTAAEQNHSKQFTHTQLKIQRSYKKTSQGHSGIQNKHPQTLRPTRVLQTEIPKAIHTCIYVYKKTWYRKQKILSALNEP